MLRELFLLRVSLGCSAAVLAGVVAANAYAARIEFKTFYDGTRVEGSEVCFLPKSFEHDRVAGLLATREMKCLPADTILQIPRGEWYFYARNEIGLVSPHRGEFSYLERSGAEDTYKSVRLEVVPAARLDVEPLRLGPEDRFFAWGRETPEYQAPVYMLEPGASTLLVPAGTSVIPIVSRNGTPVWIGRPATPSARKTIAVVRSEPAADRMNVLAWIRLPTRRLPPEVPSAQPVIDIDGEIFTPLADFGPVRFGSFNAGAFYDLPKRPGSLRVRGGLWQAKSVAFSPGKGTHLFITDPLLLTPAPR